MTILKQKHLIASVLFLFIFISIIIDYSDNSYAASFTAMSEWNLPLPAGNYRITQGDSEDPYPCDSADGGRRSHCSEGKTLKYAIDIAWQGSHDIDQMPLLAPSDGVVYEIGNYGDIKYLSILHPDDGLISHFQHIDTTQIYVQKGQSVERGQCLGRVDTSGTNVAHLHFIILNRENTAGVKITAIDGNSNFTYKDPPNTTIIRSNNRRLEDLNGCDSKAPVAPVIPIPKPMPPPTESNRPPNKPSLVKPYDMYGSKNSTFELCAQENGDPDKGDYVTGYYFDIYESAQTWDSGWVASNCVTTTPLNPFVYRWRVKVRDTHGQISEWSNVWHFDVQKNGEELPPPEANPLKTPSIISPNESTIFQKSSFILPRDGIHNDN